MRFFYHFVIITLTTVEKIHERWSEKSVKKIMAKQRLMSCLYFRKNQNARGENHIVKQKNSYSGTL